MFFFLPFTIIFFGSLGFGQIDGWFVGRLNITQSIKLFLKYFFFPVVVVAADVDVEVWHSLCIHTEQNTRRFRATRLRLLFISFHGNGEVSANKTVIPEMVVFHRFFGSHFAFNNNNILASLQKEMILDFYVKHMEFGLHLLTIPTSHLFASVCVRRFFFNSANRNGYSIFELQYVVCQKSTYRMWRSKNFGFCLFTFIYCCSSFHWTLFDGVRFGTDGYY